MTIYYLSSVDGSDSDNGLSWTNAFLTFKYAVETASAAASGPHTLLVDSVHSESLSADTTITAVDNINILCVNRSTGALATGAVVGAQASNYLITIAGGYEIYIRGMSFIVPGTGSDAITIGATDGAHYELEYCTLSLTSTNSGCTIKTGDGGGGLNTFIRLTDCTMRFGHVSQGWIAVGKVEATNLTIDSAGSAPTPLVEWNSHANVILEGCNLSHVTGTLFNYNSVAESRARVVNCKLGSGVTIHAAAATILNKGGSDVFVHNCDAGDNHYAFAHYDAFGETTVTTDVYCKDGAKYDGINGCSWKISTTANCSYYTPYVSPWIDVYYDNNIPILPYLEFARTDTTSALQNNEIWSEWSYQGYAHSTRSIINNSDRMIPLGTPEDQTSSFKVSIDWERNSSSTCWFGKLSPTSEITPLEIGFIRSRICVGKTNLTVYVDPKIRGLL